jgi:N-acetyl-anhydromuramyl-L-alanine amidase AmpD
MVAKYEFALPNLLSMKQKPGAYSASRGRRIVDEIVLHGTESLGTETQSLNYLSGANEDSHSIHYWIGRTSGLLYSITAEEKLTFHAGNPKKHPAVMDHNARSIGIEMYQVDPAVTRKAGGTPDFTDWQYDTVVQLVYDICYRRKIKRSMVVAHGTINPIDRADPQGFDWDRFKQGLWFLSFRMGSTMGSQYFLLD